MDLEFFNVYSGLRVGLSSESSKNVTKFGC